MESGAKGCEVVVSGKLRGQRAKSMKFVDGLMIHSGEPTNHYVDTAIRHVYLRQGMRTLYIVYLRWYQTICSMVFLENLMILKLACHGQLSVIYIHCKPVADSRQNCDLISFTGTYSIVSIQANFFVYGGEKVKQNFNQ